MGVTGLWNVVHPCARPIKIETLNKKRLAVDASIWIYQFLKAVRDKEGNALQNSHVVGFFRRICKLLYLGIKPVFVFDGGAPALKRQTINNRKRRREGRRDDAVKTAGKLLALQMQRIAEEEEQKRKEAVNNPAPAHEEPLPENLVYAEEIQMTPQERQKNRKFKKKDAYHLPELDASLAEMGQPNDPRIMSLEELQHYANQFQTGEDINVYDFSKIDFDSPFFTSLPAGDRYNILNAARLRSRLRMGHSKEQLDAMFPNRMEFSRFQIERVTERNNLTQRLMHINGAEGDLAFGVNGTSRVAGEKGREYVLVKNDGVEGGWALGVVSNEGKREKPIDVDAIDKVEEEDINSDEDMEFEDVPIEGVNRLPKLPLLPANDLLKRDAARRQALYKARKRTPKKSKPADPDSLFVASESEEEEGWEDVPIDIGTTDSDGDALMADEDEDLQKAIAMSMQQHEIAEEVDEVDDFAEVFQQTRVEDSRPFTKGSGKSIAHVANAQSSKVIPAPSVQDDSDEEISLQAALVKSRESKHEAKSPIGLSCPAQSASPSKAAKAVKAPGFDGPLPFEKLNLGSSLLGRKKMKQIEDDQAGGFEREAVKSVKKPESRPLPPWFQSDLEDGLAAQKELEDRQRERDRAAAERENTEKEFVFEQPEPLRKRDSPEVIDLEGKQTQDQEIIEIRSSDDEDIEDLQITQTVKSPTLTPQVDPPTADAAKEFDFSATTPQVEEEQVVLKEQPAFRSRQSSPGEQFEWEDSDYEAEPQSKSPNADNKILEPEVTNEADSEDEYFEDVVVEVASATPIATTPRIAAREAQRPPLVLPPISSTADQLVIVDLENEPDDQYSDPEDEELFRQLIQEEEENARFTATLNNRSVQQNIADYEKELKQLRNQQKKDRRDADEVTQTMITECQQLLALFGLPYITAPMEAEAQCAELVKLGLVDGIVTDDSDVFLFGGTRVYKNVFNQAKFVECYITSDLESEFGLTRERLISIAQLLGSDYTEGLAGIGPVTALEILSEFDDLAAFKDWWTKVQANQIPKSDDANNPFRKKFRRNTTKIFLPNTFPDPRVELAYLEPEVDSDPSEFMWGVPDLSALRSFLMSTIGWSTERTDEVLVPVIRDMNMRQKEGTQANITAFFGGGVGAGAFAPRARAEAGSRRLEGALIRIGERARGRARNEDASEQVDAPSPTKKAPVKKAKRTKRVLLEDESGDDADEEFVELRKKARKGAKTGKNKTGNTES